jgi:predicted RNase H-like nuclease (RuvC/YqgF family)
MRTVQLEALARYNASGQRLQEADPREGSVCRHEHVLELEKSHSGWLAKTIELTEEVEELKKAVEDASTVRSRLNNELEKLRKECHDLKVASIRKYAAFMRYCSVLEQCREA